METLLRPQEPAAPQEPSASPALGSRAWKWYTERYLPYAEQDERMVKLSRAFTRERILNGEAALEKLKAYEPNEQEVAMRHFETFQRTYDEAKKFPLRATTIFREAGSDRRMFDIAAGPQGLDILKDLSTQADDGELFSQAADAVNMANLARIGQVMLAGKTADPGGAAGLTALARGGVEWGESIERDLQETREAEAMNAMDMRRPMSGALQRRVAVNAEYQKFAYDFAQGLAQGAARVGVDYNAPTEEPKSAAEARQLFLDALPIATQVQERVIGFESKDLGLYGPENARLAMAKYAKLLYAVQSKMPEKGADLEEIQAILEAHAAGESVDGGPVADVALAALKTAGWVLEKIGRVDQAANAILYGKVGTTAPVRFKFADGTKFTDPFDAAEYSQKILAAGGEYRSPQSLINESAESRYDAAFMEWYAAENPIPGSGQTEQGVIAGFGRLLQMGIGQMQEGLRRAGDAFDSFGVAIGALESRDIDPKMAARPVVEYGVTKLPDAGYVDWGKIGSALWEGEGQFIGDTIRENTSTKADQDLGYRMTGWVLAEAPAVILSPWNAVHTGQVAARSVSEAKERLLGEAGQEVAGSASRAPKVYRFTDGRQMNAEWAAVREKVADDLGAGGVGDLGGSGDIADVLLTEVRDSPGQSWDEIAGQMKNRPGFLDEMGFLAEQSGLPPWVTQRAAGMDAAEYAASRSRSVASVLDEALAKAKPVIEQAPLTFGYKDFWEDQASRAWKMQAKRGIYFGPVGVPLGPISQRLAQTTRGVTEKATQLPVLKQVIAPFSALKRAAQSVFLTSHVGTQTAAQGTRGILPDAIKIPYRMRKAFERQYRLQAATLDSRAQMTTFDLLSDGEKLIPEADRKLVSLLAEAGRTAEDQARFLVDHADAYGPLVGWTPSGANQTERYASALALSRRLNGTVSKVQFYLDETFRDLAKAGILDDGDFVRNYVTHFYHGPAGAKTIRPVDEIVAKLEQRRVAAVQNQTGLNRGPTAIQRIGPESLIDAIRLGEYQPELDISKLLHYRTTHALKAELDAAFMGRIARTFGTPMMRGKEAAVRLAQAVRGTDRWQTEVGFSNAVLRREAYVKDLQGVSRLIKDKSAQLERQALSELAQELGVPLSKFHDERMLVGAMMESEGFLRKAASGRKGSLDKMMTPEARKSLREISREMLVHRENMRVTSLALRDLGVEIPGLAELSDAELARVAQRASEALQQRAGRLPVLERELKMAKAEMNAVRAEGREIGARVKAEAEQMRALTKEREKIAKAWDKAKAEAAEAGLVADDLSSARSLDDVRKAADGPGQDVAFARYKEAQADYVANAQAMRQAKERMASLSGLANRQKSALSKSKTRLDAKTLAVKDTKAKARSLDTARRRAGRLGAEFNQELDSTVQGFLESARAFQEARRGATAILGSGRAHGVANALRGAATRVAAHGQSVRAALSAFENKHGIGADLVRQRALTPRTIPGAAGSLKRREAALAAPPQPGIKRPFTPTETPARSQADLIEYGRAQEALDALEISRSEQSALLWEVFRARSLTEVPLHELRLMTDSSGPMRASIIRFIVDPYGDTARKAVRRMDVGPDSPAVRVGRALGVSMTGPGEQIAENIERTLAATIANAEKGSERAQRILAAIPASDLAKVYSYADLGHAARTAMLDDQDIRGLVSTLSAKDRGALERQLRTTFIPLEIGLAMKTLMGEGVFKKADGFKVALATRFGEGLASFLGRWIAPMTRGFKTAAVGYRASLLPGRRNSLFDGVRSMVQLGAWGFFSPSVRKAFRADTASKAGVIQTATGLVSRDTFERIWTQRGAAMFGAMADSLDEQSRALTNSLKQVQSKRFTREIEEVGREGKRTTGINIPSGAGKSAAIGGGLTGALANDVASGAALGFGFYGFLAGSLGLRRIVHSSGKTATKAEWLLPIGPNAMERLDNSFRKFVYWTYVKSGMAPADAMDAMLKRMRDMTNLTPAERSIVQHLASAGPFMFYNFTKQNGIAQLVRFLDNPAPTIHLMRTFQTLSDSYARDDDTRAFWQNVTDTIVKRGKAWNLQDETTAALNLLSPVTGLIEGLSSGQPLTGLKRGLLAMGTTGQSAPIWQAILGETGPTSLPLPLASKILEQYGSFEGAGMRAYINEQGVPRVDLTAGMSLAAQLTGAVVALNDVGRLQSHIVKDDWKTAIGEVLGMGRIYDQQSELELEINRFNETERMGIEVADWLEVNEITGDTLMDALGLTPQEKAVVQEMLRYQNGKDMAEQIGALRKRFQNLKGKNQKALAGRTPTPERN